MTKTTTTQSKVNIMKIISLLAVATIASIAFAKAPVNETCPFTGNPVNPEVTLSVDDVEIAFCCGGCKGGFAKWDKEKQLTYIADQKSEKQVADSKAEIAVHTPYLLDICPISGNKLDSMGGAVVEIIDGREVRFCCGGCVPKFNEDKTAQFEKLDKLMIQQQLPFYPGDTCVISGEKLDFHDGVVNFIYGNRLFRVCCNNCKAEFLEDPARYVPELDDKIIKLQKRTYPLSTCIIGKGPLDGMGGPDYMIVGNRLVKLCCAGCRDKVMKDPLSAFALIDAGN